MLKHYFKIAWRHLWRNKTFSLINIIGLALGIASAMVIIFHVKQELSYDKGFSKGDRIFRVTQEGLGDDTRHWAATSFPMGEALKRDIPGIKETVRFYRPYPLLVLSSTPATGEVKRFEEKGGFFADAAAIDMFDLAFVRGDRQSALNESNSIILTEETAKKYFGEGDPVGNTLMDDLQQIPMKVTGVVRAFSHNSHLKFDYLISMPTITHYIDQASLDRRTWNGFYNYVLIDNQRSRKDIEARLPAFTNGYFEKAGQSATASLPSRLLHLQSIQDIHLHSKLEKEMYANSDITYVYIFSLAAFFILLVAAVNFINMSTAQAFNRTKEIGLRKVVGATRPQLIRQYLGESLLSTILATLLALVLFRYTIVFYNQLMGRRFEIDQLLSLPNLGLLLALVMSIALLAGIYPAWFVSNFNPVASMKGRRTTNYSVNAVRKGLIVFQFVVAVFMIFSTIIIYRQMRLFHNKDLGFDKEEVVALTMYPDMWKNFPALSEDINKDKAFSGYAIVSTLPGERFSTQPFAPLADVKNEDLPSTRAMYADDRLLSTLHIDLKQGRNFLAQFPDIKKNEFIINESAVQAFHLKDPLGQRFVLDADTGNIVGVVKDFNFASLHSKVEPLVIQYHPYRANYLLLKVQPNQIKKALAGLAASVKALSPASVFSYTFVDEKLNQLYESENRMSSIFKVFASLAILISCIGLFGLSAYAARLRMKELSIRKVLGASVSNVVLLLSGNFVKLILLGTLIALPLGWWVMSRWLDGFAYRVSIAADVFVISGCFVLLLGFFTVSAQGLKAALVNPVKNLKE